MNKETLRELVGYDIDSFSDEILNVMNMEVMSEVAATIELEATSTTNAENVDDVPGSVKVYFAGMRVTLTADVHAKKGEIEIDNKNVCIGDEFNYTILITNISGESGAAATGVKVVFTLPSSNINQNGEVTGGTATAVGKVITVNVGDISNTEGSNTKTITIPVIVAAS